MQMKDTKQLVTAVITTHKREAAMLERALKSVLDQTYKNIEVIVVDDSPADFPGRPAVKEMMEQKYPQVIYIQHETCQGACAARNTALARAKGTFFALLDDDDEWLPRKTQRQLEAFTSDSIALVYSNVEQFNEMTGAVTPVIREGLVGQIYEKLLRNNFVGSCSYPMLRTAALREIGGFDVEMQSAQDHDVWLRLMQIYEAGFVDEILVRYYIHAGDQITKSYQRQLAGKERINLKNLEYLQAHPEIYWYRKIRLVRIYVKAGQNRKALQTWWQAVTLKPGYVGKNLFYFFVMLKNMIVK